MRRKLITLLTVMAVMAVVLSVTAFAASEPTVDVTTDFGVFTAFFEGLKLMADAFFSTIQRIYDAIVGLFA